MSSYKPAKSKKPSEARAPFALINEFVRYKRSEGAVGERYIKQLKSRLTPFGTYLEEVDLKKMGPKEAVAYRDLLNANQWAPKTLNEHVSVAKQFCSWCEGMRYIRRSPFTNVRLKVSDSRKDSELRLKWQELQLGQLLACLPFRGVSGRENSLITLFQLCAGLRPSEACQLRCEDIQKDDASGIWYVNVSSDGDKQHLKTPIAPTCLPTNGATG